MKRRIFKTFLMFGIFLLFSILMREDVRTGSGRFELEVDEEGNISWESIVNKARNDIRWRTQGFNILINKTELGYPFGENNEKNQIHIRIRNDGENVIVKGIQEDGNKLRVTYLIKGEKIREEILKKASFNNALMKKIREKQDAKIYLNQYFETYNTVQDDKLKQKVIKAFKNSRQPQYKNQFRDGYFQYRGEEYYYNSELSEVIKIRSKNLHNIRQIKMAENWVNKNEWNSTEYYNHPVHYKISSNVIVGFVGTNDEILGNNLEGEEKKECNIFFRDKKNRKIFNEKIKKVEIEGKEVLNPRLGFKMEMNSDNEMIKRSLLNFYPKMFINNQKKYVGDKINIVFPESIKIKGKKSNYRFKSCYFLEGKEKIYLKANYDEKENYIVDLELEIGRKRIYGIYEKKEREKTLEEDAMEGEGSPNPIAKIGAGRLEHSEFDIEEGIPVTEEYYEQVRVENYILNYRFKKKTGFKSYLVKSEIRWSLSWIEFEGSGENLKLVGRNKTVTSYYDTIVKRKFSYWVIDKLEYYSLDGAYLENKALVDSEVKIFPKDCIYPKIDFIHSEEEESHILEPIELGNIIFLGNKSAWGNNVPEYDPSSQVDGIVGKIKVRNDNFIFDGSIVMDDTWELETTNRPNEPRTEGDICGEKTLYREGKKIENTVKNGIYDSYGKVIYKLEKSINSENEDYLEYEIEGVNSVRIHTPTVCDYRINDATEWCQLVEPDLSLYQLVLTKEFELDILTSGVHLPIKGYGDRNFEKYVKTKEVIFPFDISIYGIIYPKEIAIPLIGNTVFRVPEYVKEGKYEIKIRTLALNSFGEEEKKESYANLEMENYVAVSSIFVEVSGRLMHFSLENIKNTSIWEKVFQRRDFQRGIFLKNLPVINGDHPFYKNIGDFRKGYAIEFGVTTIGEYYEERYGIGVDFEFYATDEEYKNKKKVDVYYEAISEKNGKRMGLVRVGSKIDKKNIHFYKKGERKIPLFTYDRLLCPVELLYSGSDRRIQRWRGEYCMPARLHICEKGFPIEAYLKRNMALYFDEEFWIRKGKLILKANIYTMKKGKKVLSYINEGNFKSGFLNNWRYETMGRRKYNRKKEVIDFQDGEVFVYDIAKSIQLERRSEVKRGY